MLQKRTFAFTTLAIFAILLLIAGGGAAHGDDTNDHDRDDVPADGTAKEWAEWMEYHIIDHVGKGAAKQMQERMDISYEEMGEMMAGDGGMMGEQRSGMGCH